MNTRTKPMILLACLVATIGFVVFTNTAAAQSRRRDEQKVAHRGDVRLLPAPLTARQEKRLRFIPSGLANEILLDVYVRVASFEPGTMDKEQRLFDAYAKEIARVDQNGDGIVDAVEADLEGTSDNPPQSNDRLFIPATQFNRLAVTREINDGLLAPRFAPSQRAWVLSVNLVPVSPTVNASIPQDADNR